MDDRIRLTIAREKGRESAVASPAGDGTVSWSDARTTEAAWDLLGPDVQALFPCHVVRAEDGGVLDTQQEPQGGIVGTAGWAQAWQAFTLS